jgi:hypothetical protein
VSLAATRRWCGRFALAVLFAAAMAFVVLRVIVAQVPTYAAEIRRWVEAQTR